MALPFVGKRPPKRVAKLPSPGEVFTPRSANVTDMYVERPALEEALRGLYDTSEVCYLYGHSGSGKTWLYKKVFRTDDVYFYVIPLQDLTDDKSFDDLIRHHLSILGRRIESSTTTAIGARGGLAGVGASAVKSTKSRPYERAPMDLLLGTIREYAAERRAVLVFENVERGVRRPDVLNELTKIIMSVDHDNFAIHDVRVLLVGTVKDLISRISDLPDSAPILGRITTLPEVSRLSTSESRQLVEHGLFDLLQLEPTVDRTRFVKRILDRTDRLPLHLHNYCLEIAKSAIARERKIDGPAETNGFHRWVANKVAQYANRVFAHMNSKDTALKVRTRVLYCISRAQLSEFRALDAKQMMDTEWPELGVNNTSVTSALNDLAGEVTKKEKPDPILERVSRAGVNHYRFIDPVYRIAARNALKKNATGEIEREELLGEI